MREIRDTFANFTLIFFNVIMFVMLLIRLDVTRFTEYIAVRNSTPLLHLPSPSTNRSQLCVTMLAALLVIAVLYCFLSTDSVGAVGCERAYPCVDHISGRRRLPVLVR